MKYKIPSAKNNTALKLADTQCQKAVQLINQQNYEQALAVLDSILKPHPEHRLAKRSKPVVLFYMGRHQEAAKLFHQLHEQDPEDLVILKHCGVAYTAAGAFDMAIRFLSRYVKSKPDDFDAWANLSAAAGKSQKYVESMMYATKALSLEPTNPAAYNNLGATLLGVNKFDEAAQAFETALVLDKNNLDALSNLSTLAEKRGDYAAALVLYNNLLDRLDHSTTFAKEVLYRSSFSHLATGQLAEGWRRYDYGFLPKDLGSRTPKRQFQVPQWYGEPLGDKRLLIWGEQGLGDELWFFGLLNEALAHCHHVIVECEPRLVGLMTRSFPDVKVRAINLGPMMLMESHDFDLHIPVGSLMALFRNNMEDLKKFKPYLQADPDLSVDFSKRLTPFKGKKLIGLCWRSGKLDANRNKHYLPLNELAPLLKLKDCVFVNLQYGDCEEELSRLEQQLGISIVRWADVDLKNNLEHVTAIISCLDAVVSAGTAVFRMAEVVGQETILFGPKGSWTHLGQENYPWSNCVHHFSPSTGDDLNTVIPKIIEYVNANVTASQSKTDQSLLLG
jgi:tetratricopeptide (TPR) repeat protein